jgi:hypothetical protein
MRTHIINRVPDFDIRSLTDHVLWYKDYLIAQEIEKVFQRQTRIMEAVRGNVITFLEGVIKIGAEDRALSTYLLHPYTIKRDIPAITRYRAEQTGRPDPYADVFFLFQDEPTSTFRNTILGHRFVKVPNWPTNLTPTPGVNNKETINPDGGPPDWRVVPEGTTSIPIIGKLLPQDDVEEIRTSLTIPEGCFTASPYGLRHGKPGTLPGAEEASGGPTPGIDCPGAGNGDATPSTPTLQEPPSAAR